MRYLTLAVFGALLVACSESGGDDQAGMTSATWWPPFERVYVSRDGVGDNARTTTTRIIFQSPSQWVVHVGRVRQEFDGESLTIHEPDGTVEVLSKDEAFDGQSEVTPFSQPWGAPIASRDELLAEGWEPYGSHGDIRRVTHFTMECGSDAINVECAGLSGTVEASEELIRDKYGIPVSAKEIVGGRVVRETTRLPSID